MHKILAISGGVDSMVLLHLFRDDPDIVVAHFNHGTRPSADADEDFVHHAAEQLQLPFCVRREQLGPDTSEATARQARYDFLFNVAEYYNGMIYTAHHLDDLAESIAINLTRGTGWRGLCALSNPFIIRPFLQPELMPGGPWDKARIYKYAARHQLTWRQDPTNHEDTYLRNRLRAQLSSPALRPVAKSTLVQELFALWRRQNDLRYEIDGILGDLIPDNLVFSRAPFAELDDTIACEVLGAYLDNHGISATRPQLADFLHAVRTYTPGKKFNLPGGLFALISRDTFRILPPGC